MIALLREVPDRTDGVVALLRAGGRSFPSLLGPGTLGAVLLAAAAATAAAVIEAAPLDAQTVRGHVVEADGTPVPWARVELHDASDRITAADVADERGRFLLHAVRPGLHTVRVRRIGLLEPLERVIELGPGEEATLVLVALPAAIVLDSIRAVTERREPFLEAQGFYRRSATGYGTFFDRAAIDSLDPHGVNDLLRRIPSVRFKYDHLGRRFPYFRDPLGAYSEPCYPLIFIDGLEAGGAAGWVEGLLHPADVAALEAYAGGATVPPRFARRGHGCGVLVFWTRTRE